MAQNTFQTIIAAVVSYFTRVSASLRQFFNSACEIPEFRKSRTQQTKPTKLDSNTSKTPARSIKSTNASRRNRKSYIEHDHSECLSVVINVSGCRYETQIRTLNRFPNTLLGNPELRLRYYDPEKDEYFFDRNPFFFEPILHFYQNGGYIQRPESIPFDIFCREIMFYQLGDEAINKFRVNEGMTPDTVYELPKNLLQRKLWVLFEFPESSIQAKIIGFLSVFVVVMSIFIFCIDTIPSFEHDHDFDNTTLNEHLSKGHDPNDQSHNTSKQSLDDPFFFSETVCMSWFIFEFVIRFICSPRKFAFWKDIMNIIDFITIIPYFLIFVAEAFKDSDTSKTKSTINTFVILRVVRLVRVFRIFKLSRHSKGLKVLAKTVRASIKELAVFVFILLVCVVLFASAMYYIDTDANTFFISIPDGFWWAMQTMTTLGYGDMYPVTPLGKVIGSLCAIMGVLTIALPVPIIVSNFNYYYNQENENMFDSKTDTHVEGCPFLPAGYGPPPAEYMDTKVKAKVKKASRINQSPGSTTTASNEETSTDPILPETIIEHYKRVSEEPN